MVLKGYGKAITNVFQLLGNQENDITKAIAYLFANSTVFLSLFLKNYEIKSNNSGVENINVYFQEQKENGITDIEIIKMDDFHIIIEAKVCYKLPSFDQLNKYAYSLLKSKNSSNYIFSMSNLRSTIAESELPKSINNVPVKHISFCEILELAKQSISNSKKEERVFLKHFILYMKGIIDMQDKQSNVVYVVPIDKNSIVEHDKLRQYHCPVGNGFLKEPCNYLGFRYGGKLQYINHVEKVDFYKEDGKLYFCFSLGPDIVPQKEVKTGGKLRGTKFYCDIDLLLTCDTIIEANQKTKDRHS